MSVGSFLGNSLRRGRTLWLILVALIASYAVTGFLVLPLVIKAQAPKRLRALLGREVLLQRVRVNPFALSVTLDGFQILDPDGGTFFGWDRLYVNAQLSSAFTHTVSFSAIHLAHPYGRVVLGKGGRMNFSDILDRFPAQAPKTNVDASEPRQIRIGALAIQGAEITLVDRSLDQPFTTTLGPLSIRLADFCTAPDSRSPYTFSGRTESGETFSWTGQFSADPLKSEGRFAIEHLRLPKYQPYLRDQVAFDLREGELSVRASYRFEWTAGHHAILLQDGEVDLLKLALADPQARANAVVLPVLEARAIQADLLENAVEIGSLRLKDGHVDLARLKNGEIDLAKLLTPKPQPKKAEAKPFHLTLKELGLSGFSASFEDRAVPRPVKLQVLDLGLTLRDFSLDPKASSDLTLAMRINGGGRLQAEGRVAPLKPTADLAIELSELDLPVLDAYLEPATDIRVNRGSLSLKGHLRAAFEGRSSDAITFKGDVRLANFEAMDGARREPFLRYRALRLTGLDLQTNPKVVTLANAELIESENRLVISKDGSSNVERALKLQPTATSVAAMAPATPRAAPDEAFRVSIGQVKIQNSRLTFIDRSVEPNAALTLSDLNGVNRGLSTEVTDKASLDLKGLAGGLAPLLIQGRAMPLRHDKDTDVTVKISGADLTDFTPYTGKFLGYTVRQGKLDVDARLRIQDRKLQVEDKVRLNQFYLGDKVDSPDATHLPVRLGLALLRDRKGVIELDVPVDGSLDDPDIHYGRMIWKALLNALSKVVTSPFTLLSHLFGSGEDLSSAVFTAGHATLDASEQKKFATLAKALHERPELRLEVESTVDAASDGAALRRAKLEDLLRRIKASAEKRESVAVLPADERERWLRVAYDAAFPAPKGVKPVPPPIAEVEQRLLGTLTVHPDELRALADARNRATILALRQEDLVESDRIFEVNGGDAAKAGGAKVYFTLK